MKSILRRLPFLTILTCLALVAGLAARASAADEGATTFKSKCAMCHGADGAGKTPMGVKLNIQDLTSAAVQKQSDAELESVISGGRNKMPAYSGKLSKEQTSDTVKFIRSLAKK